MTSNSIDKAIADLRSIAEPYARLREADELDAALVVARSVVAQIKRDTISSLRTPATGYGTIAQRLGLTKARVQQIANAPRRPVQAAYAFRDEAGGWHGDIGQGHAGPLMEAPTFIPFSPADEYNPLGGQTLLVLYGPVNDDDGVSVHTLQIRQPDGSPLNVRMTSQVQDALYGPRISGTPERNAWEAARERRRRTIEKPE
ncbi:MAG TPA: hypothetical protein VK817_02935 [Trebonia sp.]|jgi:hypothetical protein|nr:hypothetical protein [Trebonia sp.]